MNTKRLLSLILALMMVFSLVACGDAGYVENDDDDEDQVQDATGNAGAAVTPEDSEATNSAEGETTAPTEPQPTEPQPTEPEESTGSSLGIWNGNTYTNEYAGFQITFDENWTYMTANELQEMPDTIQGMIDDTILGQLMTSFVQFTDMNANNNTTGNGTNIVYQEIPTAQKDLLSGYSDEEIIDFQLLSKELLKETYAAMGIEVTTMEKTTVNFLGKTVYALKTTASYMGLDVYMVQLTWYNLGDWSVSLTITTYINDATQEVLNMYKPA